jgi:YD repeat-containing protein
VNIEDRIIDYFSVDIRSDDPTLIRQNRNSLPKILAARRQIFIQVILFCALSLSLNESEADSACNDTCGEGPIRVYLPGPVGRQQITGYGYTAIEACKNLYRAYKLDVDGPVFKISAGGANNCWTNVVTGCDLYSSPADGWIDGPVCIVEFDSDWWKDVFAVRGGYYDDTNCELTDNGTNPINSATGNKFEIEEDFGGQLEFVRYYNALSIQDGSLGVGWTHTHNYSIFFSLGTPQRAYAKRPNGKVYEFIFQQNNWIPTNNSKVTLQEAGNEWQLRGTENIVETYNSSGLLTEIIDKKGHKRVYVHDTENRLTNVSDAFGNQLLFGYDTENKIVTVTDQDGGMYHYGYDASNNLTSATYPDNTPNDLANNPKRQYLYEDSRFPNALTGIIDENGIRSATWAYDDHGRANSSEHADGSDRATVTYNSDGTTTVTNALGKQTTYHFDVIKGAYRVTQAEGHPTTLCAGANQAYTYDDSGFLTSKTDWNGNLTTYVRDANGLETSRTEASGTPDARTITTEWHSDFRLPLRITEPDIIYEFSYDHHGQIVNKQEHSVQ